jgi:F0F1-type ATP synthase membrane subunit a
MHGYVPLVLYMAMFILELGVSLVQAYVLTLLAITFMKEAVEIH